jgi:hypothetical protein
MGWASTADRLPAARAPRAELLDPRAAAVPDDRHRDRLGTAASSASEHHATDAERRCLRTVIGAPLEAVQDG